MPNFIVIFVLILSICLIIDTSDDLQTGLSAKSNGKTHVRPSEPTEEPELELEPEVEPEWEPESEVEPEWEPEPEVEGEPEWEPESEWEPENSRSTETTNWPYGRPEPVHNHHNQHHRPLTTSRRPSRPEPTRRPHRPKPTPEGNAEENTWITPTPPKTTTTTTTTTPEPEDYEDDDDEDFWVTVPAISTSRRPRPETHPEHHTRPTIKTTTHRPRPESEHHWPPVAITTTTTRRPRPETTPKPERPPTTSRRPRPETTSRKPRPETTTPEPERPTTTTRRPRPETTPESEWTTTTRRPRPETTPEVEWWTTTTRRPRPETTPEAERSTTTTTQRPETTPEAEWWTTTTRKPRPETTPESEWWTTTTRRPRPETTPEAETTTRRPRPETTAEAERPTTTSTTRRPRPETTPEAEITTTTRRPHPEPTPEHIRPKPTELPEIVIPIHEPPDHHFPYPPISGGLPLECQVIRCPTGYRCDCINPCPANCKQPDRKPCSIYVCQAGCVCATGHVLNANGTCIAVQNCPKPEPPAPVRPVCSKLCTNGKQCVCENACPATCAEPEPPACPTTQCNIGCHTVCKKGQVLDRKGGQCIPLEYCPNRQCIEPTCADRDNQIYHECSTRYCNRTCAQPAPYCTDQCVKPGNYDCRAGTVRDQRTGRCVPYVQCSQPIVCERRDEVFYECDTRLCQRTCQRPNVQCPPPTHCRRPGNCDCRPGFVRDVRTCRCVDKNERSCLAQRAPDD